MTRAYLLLAFLGLLLIGVFFCFGSRQTDSTTRSMQGSNASESDRREPRNNVRSISSTPPSMVLGRDLLRFKDEEQSGSWTVESVGSAEPISTSAPEQSVRLVGFIRVGESHRAALVIDGILEVLEVRQESAGYVLLQVDADAGFALVRTPAGEEMTLESEPS